MDIPDEVKKHGWRVRFIPHEKIKDYIACYNVVYEGKKIYPPAALRLRIPENEIWISDAFEEYTPYILFHELQEIKHRAEGYNVEEAHSLALEDEERRFGSDENWLRMKMEINICTFKSLVSTPGIGKVLAERIMENRPYAKMDDLLKIRGIGQKRFRALKHRFWCILEGYGFS